MGRNKPRRAAAVSLLLLAASAVLLTVLFSVTGYTPLILSAIILLFPALADLVLLIFGAGGAKPKDAGAGGETSSATKTNVGKVEVMPGDTDGESAKHGAQRLIRCVGRVFKSVCAALVHAYMSSRLIASALLIPLIAVAAQIFFWLMFRRVTSVYSMNYLTPVLLAVLFVIFIVLEKWCIHSQGGADKYGAALLRGVRGAFVAGRLALVLTAVAVVVKLLGFYELQTWLAWALGVVFCYETLFILLALTVRLIRRELLTDPELSIPLPFSAGASRELGVLSYLEKNTGITMRSLWSMRLVKLIIPYTVIFASLLLWLCSGIAVIEPYQEGAVYRCGRLLGDTLSPGIHLTLPWPFDRTVLYSTGSINRITVGYVSSEDSDNTWTGKHGSNEYKLLLGGGNELISINLRVEYKINDLCEYLRSSSAPEKLLEAKAYEMVTARTINTSLDTLLSVDRSSFADSFRSELAADIDKYNIGLEVVSVVLESIHPPMEIAALYQRMIGAGIEAEKYILDAEAKAAVTVAQAEKSHDTALNAANADSYGKIAAANADVAEFMASVNADRSYPDTYRYYKYLNAISNAYGGARLVIVGEGIDGSQLYFGSLVPGQ